MISIHAPRTGSDLFSAGLVLAKEISIHAPRTGSDIEIVKECAEYETFQSTLPARGATLYLMVILQVLTAFQSTLPARGATL